MRQRNLPPCVVVAPDQQGTVLNAGSVVASVHLTATGLGHVLVPWGETKLNWSRRVAALFIGDLDVSWGR